ncbi:MAG: hypothetical protein UX72_C0003G0060 [Parcubacteria group bacterium GW2011_GWA2_47_10]|nr:MAG: hypothetical protein UX72_C0003G0060 [Parcubacteria group bacterium GW2011_GWA2_47_10]
MKEKILKNDPEKSEEFGESDEEQGVQNDFRSKIEKLVKQGKIPPTNVDIFFSAHKTTEDIKGFEERLKNADIYIPEALGWDEEALSSLREVSEGRKTPRELIQELQGNPDNPEYAAQLYRAEMLYGTKKPLGIIDLPDSSQFFEHLKKRVVDFSNSVNFEQILDTYLAHLEEDADFEKKREEHMLDSLGPVLEKLVKEHPELSKKKGLNVFMTLGSAHTGVYHGLKEGGIEAARSFKVEPYCWGYEVEAIRRYRFGKPVDETLAARAFFERVLKKLLPELFMPDDGNSEISTNVARRVISVFSCEEIRPITESKNHEQFFDKFLTAVEKKGLKPYVKEILQKHFAKEEDTLFEE